jgi:hypothetical protein
MEHYGGQVKYLRGNYGTTSAVEFGEGLWATFDSPIRGGSGCFELKSLRPLIEDFLSVPEAY